MTFATRLALLLLMAISCALPATLSAESDTPGTVVKLTLHDTIQPITADYLQRGLREAARVHAQAVLVSMGTPGGLLESTRVMVQAIETSPVPVASINPALLILFEPALSARTSSSVPSMTPAV